MCKLGENRAEEGRVGWEVGGFTMENQVSETVLRGGLGG